MAIAFISVGLPALRRRTGARLAASWASHCAELQGAPAARLHGFHAQQEAERARWEKSERRRVVLLRRVIDRAHIERLDVETAAPIDIG